MRSRRRYYTRQYQPPERKRRGSISSILFTLLIFFALIAIIVSLPDNHQPTESMTGNIYVIDGDTVILNKVHVRLLGIDAPEMEQVCQVAGRDYLCGKEARNALHSKINGQTIRCESTGKDKYSRNLARCYLGETDLNQWMVEQGWAVSYGDYRREESDAQREKRGLWAGHFESPYQWRREHQRPNAEPEAGHDATGSMVASIRKIILRLLNL